MLLPSGREGAPLDITGEQFYRALEYPNETSAASDALRQRGIPGLKYWDQGSRAGGRGTRNYVVWEPDILNILGVEP